MAKLAVRGGSRLRTRPFTSWPIFDKHDEEILLEILKSGKWWMYAYGSEELMGSETTQKRSKVKTFEETFARMHRAKHALAVTSGSGALEICCQAVGLKPGDEVITTPYTFIATSACILHNYALPVYVDIDKDTYNINPELIEEAITERTKVIIPVHFAGEICDMERIRKIARKHHLRIIEDSAQAAGASLENDSFAGTFGDMGIFSFQQSKVLTCGEGGLVLTNNDRLADVAWSLRHCGRTKNSSWYEHLYLGWHYRMTEFQGGILLTQLEKLESQNLKRMANVQYFYQKISGFPGIEPAQLHPKATRRTHYLVILKYDSSFWKNTSRDKVVKALNAEGIPVSSGYAFPNYANPLFDTLDMGPSSLFMLGKKKPANFKKYKEICPAAEKACRESIWLPHNLFLGSRNDVDDIVNAFEKVYGNLDELKSHD